MELQDLIRVEHILQNGKRCFDSYINRKVHTMRKLDNLQYLWTTDKDKYYLEIVEGMFCIMDKNNMMLLIEDDELYISVMEKMISSGVKVLEWDVDTKQDVEVPNHIAMQKYKLFRDNT